MANDSPPALPAKPATLKEECGELGRALLTALVIALIIRSLLVEPYSIPSGSMYPTLEVGDHVFVSKPAYGWSRFSFPFGLMPFEGRVWPAAPRRGDIIVFKRTPDRFGTPYIKRIVALPGEEVQMRAGRLYINGRQVERARVGAVAFRPDGAAEKVIVTEYIETLPGGARHRIFEASDDGPLDTTGVYTVPPGHYFVMGDNRDHSQDSRVPGVVGPVPFDQIVGRADRIFFSVDGSVLRFWQWPWTLRWGRFFKGLTPERLQQD